MTETFMTLFLLSIFTVDKSFCDAPEDLAGSGLNQDSADDDDNSMEGESETKTQKNGSKLNLNQLKELVQHMEHAIFPKGNPRSFLENKHIIAAIVAGGVLGAVVAAALAAVLIIKWRNCGNGRYTAGHETTPRLQCSW